MPLWVELMSDEEEIADEGCPPLRGMLFHPGKDVFWAAGSDTIDEIFWLPAHRFPT